MTAALTLVGCVGGEESGETEVYTLTPAEQIRDEIIQLTKARDQLMMEVETLKEKRECYLDLEDEEDL